MGNRQSSPQDQNNQPSDAINDNDTTNSITTNTTASAGGGSVRPTSRVQTQRETLRSAVVPVNANQRRAERRARRERVREQQQGTPETASLFSSVAEAMTAAAALRQQQGTELNASPFSRMIASVISEAVLTSFRDGQIPTASTTTTTNSTITSTPDSPDGEEANRNSRQQLTMHLSPELFQQLEPGVAENSFMRFMRLPVIVTNVSTSDEAEEESEVTRVIMLPVFLYGIRSMQATTTNAEGQQLTAAEEETPTRRRSARIRERNQQTNTNNNSNHGGERLINGQWTVYIISGPNVDGIMNDSPSYEELLDLAALIGPARMATVSQEAIDSHVPIVKYEQVKQTIIGNAEGCQICLSSYQSQDNLRILACQHGFHDDCICKWLKTGKNQCPLCRDVPIPTTATDGTPP